MAGHRGRCRHNTPRCCKTKFNVGLSYLARQGSWSWLLRAWCECGVGGICCIACIMRVLHCETSTSSVDSEDRSMFSVDVMVSSKDLWGFSFRNQCAAEVKVELDVDGQWSTLATFSTGADSVHASKAWAWLALELPAFEREALSRFRLTAVATADCVAAGGVVDLLDFRCLASPSPTPRTGSSR